MKRVPGNDPVYDDSTTSYDVSGDESDREHFIHEARPPAGLLEQLERIEGTLDELDENDRADLEKALDLIRFYRDHLATHYLDEKPAGVGIADQLIIAATKLGAAHQRSFDRRPLVNETKQAKGRAKGAKGRGEDLRQQAAQNRASVREAYQRHRDTRPNEPKSRAVEAVMKETGLGKTTVYEATKDLR